MFVFFSPFLPYSLPLLLLCFLPSYLCFFCECGNVDVYLRWHLQETKMMHMTVLIFQT